jgi:hypothetical protein
MTNMVHKVTLFALRVVVFIIKYHAILIKNLKFLAVKNTFFKKLFHQK